MLLKKITRFSFLLIVIVYIGISVCPTFAEEKPGNRGTILGKVTDQTPEQNPIEEVRINIIASDNKRYTVKTDTNGEYKIDNLPEGLYTVFSHKDGYLPTSKKSLVVKGKETFVDLKLSNWIDTAKQDRINKIVPLLNHITEIMAKRHNLDKTVIDTLHQSTRELIETTMKHDNKLFNYLTNFTGSNLHIIEGLMSHPDIKEIFTKHLSDTQLQDYSNFINAGQHRKEQAIVNQLTVLLDQEVFLTPDQRKKISQLLQSKTDKLKLTSNNIIRLDSQEAVDRISQNLNISLNEVLTKTQMTIWHTMVDMKPNNKNNQGLEMFFARTKANLDRAVKAGRMTEKEAEEQLDTLKKQLGLEPNAEKLTPQEYMKQLLEAKLAAHADALDIHNRQTSERLTLAAQGVVQHYLETKDRMAIYREGEAKIMEAFWAKEITKEQADKQLGDLTEKIWGENIDYEDTGKPYAVDIVNHPLYQKAIKDVLSEDLYAQYNAQQVERDAFHQQVIREVVVTYIDTQLLLNDAQRKQLEVIAEDLTVQPSEKDAPMKLFYQLYHRIEQDMLSLWQHKQLELIFGSVL